MDEVECKCPDCGEFHLSLSLMEHQKCCRGINMDMDYMTKQFDSIINQDKGEPMDYLPGILVKIKEFIDEVIDEGHGEFEEDWSDDHKAIEISLVVPTDIEAESVIREVENSDRMKQFMDMFHNENAVRELTIDPDCYVEDNKIVFSFY